MAIPRYPRRDGNHVEMAAAFRGLGCTVVDLSAVGGGCPDLLVGYNGQDRLVEIKSPKQAPNKRRLRANQVDFFDTWKGTRPARIESLDDVKLVFLSLRDPLKGGTSADKRWF